MISAEKSASVQKRSAYAKPPPIDQIVSGVLPGMKIFCLGIRKPPCGGYGSTILKDSGGKRQSSSSSVIIRYQPRSIESTSYALPGVKTLSLGVPMNSTFIQPPLDGTIDFPMPSHLHEPLAGVPFPCISFDHVGVWMTRNLHFKGTTRCNQFASTYCPEAHFGELHFTNTCILFL